MRRKKKTKKNPGVVALNLGLVDACMFGYCKVHSNRFKIMKLKSIKACKYFQISDTELFFLFCIRVAIQNAKPWVKDQ